MSGRLSAAASEENLRGNYETEDEDMTDEEKEERKRRNSAASVVSAMSTWSAPNGRSATSEGERAISGKGAATSEAERVISAKSAASADAELQKAKSDVSEETSNEFTD
jgi:hypothetical protein